MTNMGKRPNGRWARNKQLAAYANVSAMQIWRWKKMPDFPPATVLNGTEYNDLDAFDAWMSSYVTHQDAGPTRGQRAIRNLRRKNDAAEMDRGAA
jgi:hypothetical protein